MNSIFKNFRLFLGVFLSLFVLSATAPINVNAQNCNCTEYLYLNDAGTGEVHKFAVDPADGSITEIGSPWMSGFTKPHGLGSDLNGFLYIGDDTTGPIYKVDCDGGTVANDATLWDSTVNDMLFNIGSYGGYIFVNGSSADIPANHIGVFDPCTGDLVGTICLNDWGWGDWGMEILPDGTILATAGAGWGDGYDAIFSFQFDESMIDGACVDPLVTEGYLNDYDSVYGITTDGTHLYVIMRDEANFLSYLYKINASTGALVTTMAEGGLDGSGWNGALGLVYSPSSDLLYISGYEDCISIVDPSDLSYLGAGAGGVVSGSEPKAIAIRKECCLAPEATDIVVDLCGTAAAGDVYFLNEMIGCEGLCGAAWGLTTTCDLGTYNACDKSFTITDPSATGDCCFDFSGTNNICGTMSTTLCFSNNCPPVCTPPTAPVISVTDNVCDPAAVGTINTDTACGTGSTMEWSTDSGTTWSTTAPNYDNATAISVMARCVDDADATCMSTNAGPVTTAPTTCPSETYDLALSKTVNTSLTAMGNQVVFTLTVLNEGTVEATGVVVTDLLPTGLIYESDNSGGNYDSATGLWTIGSIAVGGSSVIEITAIVDAVGVLINNAEITAMNETDIDSTPNNGNINEDDYASVCISSPVQICDSETINIDLIAEAGMTMYQWYKDGVEIIGATNQIFNATEIGSYTYTVDGAGPTGDCVGELCCPVIIEQISCCPPTICVPVTITKTN